ncbi:MAG: hypothetical protein ACKO7N_01095 [Candidatus Nitrosotenuis sp.]
MNVNMKKIYMLTILPIFAIILLISLTQTENISAVDEPKGNAAYVFGEGVYPQATFNFRSGTVTYDFQLYDMTNNLFSTTANGFTSTRTISPEFTLVKVVGDTPYLHKAVDQTFENGGRSYSEYDYKMFDVTIEMMQAEKSLRTIEYKDCSITNYKINTRTDNEEGYTTGGKTGFAVVETYTFACNGFNMESLDFNAMIADKQNKKPYE